MNIMILSIGPIKEKEKKEKKRGAGY